ncbi:MAG: ribosomal RNA small subunit methyltransferase A [Deltaproteobacteria bacterium]|nr:ribosomal RNA small subunit methyltransferase A [Deltaproteobacteria bacterium]
MKTTNTKTRPYPKKRLGQHFLSDGNMISKIVRTAGVSEADHVLEIGPGRGDLTRALRNAGAYVTAIEIDGGLVEALGERFKGDGRFTLIHGDALKIPFSGLSGRDGIASPRSQLRLKSVSNLPYNISGPMLFKFLEERKSFTKIVLMLQKEVASRLVAAPSTKDYGILSVLLRVYFDVKVEFDVPRELFHPRPKVASSVVSLSALPGPRIPVSDEGLFISVVKAAFGQRRKTLSNALKALRLKADIPGAPSTTLGTKAWKVTEALSPKVVLGALYAAGIDPERRGETLTLPEFGRLCDAVFKSLNGKTSQDNAGFFFKNNG